MMPDLELQGESDEALPPPGGDGGSSEEETSEGGDEVEWWGGRRKRSSPPGGYGGYGGYGSAYSQYKDALQGFQSSGVVVMTDLMLETRPCIRPRYGKIIKTRVVVDRCHLIPQ